MKSIWRVTIISGKFSGKILPKEKIQKIADLAKNLRKASFKDGDVWTSLFDTF